jgi:hypothetical protein
MSVAVLDPDSDDFRRARDIFLHARELDPDERQCIREDVPVRRGDAAVDQRRSATLVTQ